MVCPSCGSENDDSSEICFTCGKAVYALTAGALVSGRYEILGPLGKGGMGMVYKARDRELDETVALKVLRSDIAASSDLAKRFRHEIKLARKVSHRNVCRIHEYGREGHLTYIVMEFIEGVDLKRVLRAHGPLPPEEAFEAAIRLAEALQAIHEEGIIHRDLKTPNAMRDSRGNVKLMDFGIAKSYDGTTDATATGQIVGTPEYMSPEQVRGHKLDARTDIYALGIVIFELFTGDVPFRGDTPVATLFMQIQDPPPLEGPQAARIPPPLLPVLQKALAKSRDERFASAAEMAEALREARGRALPGISTPAILRAISASAPDRLVDATPMPTPMPTPVPTPVPTSVRTELAVPPPPPVATVVPTPAPRPEAPKVTRPEVGEAETVARPRPARAVRPLPPPRGAGPRPARVWLIAVPVFVVLAGASFAVIRYLAAPEEALAPAMPRLEPTGTALASAPPARVASGEPSPAFSAKPVAQLQAAPEAAVGLPPPTPSPTAPAPRATRPPTVATATPSPPLPRSALPTPGPSTLPLLRVPSAEPTMAPSPSATMPTATPPTVSPRTAPAVSPATPVPTPASEPTPAAPHPRPPVALPGTLELKIRPWAEIALDGKPMGTTLRRISLNPGIHTVVLSHPDFEPLKRMVEIKPGETFLLSVDLKDEAIRRKN